MLFILSYAFKSIILQEKFQTAKHNKSAGWTIQNQDRAQKSLSPALVTPNDGEVAFQKSLITDWLQFIDSLIFIHLPNIVKLFL